jgi:hypothetical protein
MEYGGREATRRKSPDPTRKNKPVELVELIRRRG